MTNLTCPIGSNAFDSTAFLMPITAEALVADGVPPAGQVVAQVARAVFPVIASQVARTVFPVIASIAAPYIYERAARLPEAIQRGTGMMLGGVAIVVGGFNYLRDSFNQLWLNSELSVAAYDGDTGSLRDLLASRQFSNLARGEAVCRAVTKFKEKYEAHYPSTLEDRRNDRRSNGERARDLAALTTIKERCDEIITLLLDNGGIELADEQRGTFIQFAAKDGNERLVRAILANGTISEADRGMAVREAAYEGRRDNTAANRYLGIVSLLITNEQISEGDRAVAETFTCPRIRALLQGVEYDETARVEERFYVNVEDFANNPQVYLARVAEEGLRRVTFLNPDGSAQPGIDAGGLTKQFICELGEHLIVKKVIERDEFGYPYSSKEDLTSYTQLGQVLSRLYTANQARRDSLFIGELFNPLTYALLQILARPQDPAQSPEERRRKEFTYIAKAIVTKSTQPLLDFLKKNTPSDGDIQEFKAYLAGIKMEDMPEGTALEELREECFKGLNLQKHHDALYAIFRGLSPDLKAAILREWKVGGNLQGGINGKLLDKFTCTSQDPVVLQKLEWLKEKILVELKDPEKEWIKAFLKCVTGQSVIPSGNIEIRETEETMFHAHTCISTLDVPNTYEVDPRALTAKEKFIKRLEVTMEQVGYDQT